MANRLGGSELLFSHLSMKEDWRDLPTHADWRRDERFLAALDYLLELTYTSILNKDTYPIAIQSQFLTAGTLLSYPEGESGHNYLVTRVTDGKDGYSPIQLMSSTTPREYRYLMESEFWEPVQPAVGGFRRFLWPLMKPGGGWTLAESQKMAGFSEEQFSPDFTPNQTFDESVFDRIAPQRTVDFDRKVQSMLEALFARYQERVEVVYAGHEACAPNLCPPGSRAYEDLSTPSRDKRILNQIDLIQALVREHPETANTYRIFINRHVIEVQIGWQRYEIWSEGPYHDLAKSRLQLGPE